MTKNVIQEQRMRGYFIQATKDILKGEGLKSISVRNIAERAGYSYATLYNYFKDIKDLVFECVRDFQEECEEIVTRETQNARPGAEKIQAITKSYLKFFIQYPGIFELFYLEKPVDISSKKETMQWICTFLDRLCESDWEYAVTNNLIPASQTMNIKIRLNAVTNGLLLLYLNRRFPESYQEFTQISNIQIDEIINF